MTPHPEENPPPAVADASLPAPLKSNRVLSVDILRGIVLVIMALDHTRDYFTNLPFAPEDMARSWGALFFTRWITHFCAPLFFFLAGTGAYLSMSGGKSRSQISRFLFTRGLWLVFLEYSVVGFGWSFVFPFGFAQTIWALGWSMVVLSLLVWLPVRVIAAFGVGMIALHNLTDRLAPAQFGSLGWLWKILHYPDFVWVIPQKFPIVVAYPLIPWMGVMAAGYAFGAVLKMPPEKRQRLMFLMGGCATLVFVVLRGGNLYGNAPILQHPPPIQMLRSNGPWHVQPSVVMTVASFLNVQKYPPALDYLLMTLGPGLVMLGALDRRVVAKAVGPVMRFFLVFGRVPMFYYVSHIYLVHLLAALVAWLVHQPAYWLMHGAMFLNNVPSGYGHAFPFVYLMWFIVIAVLYFPCRWFAGVKSRRKDWWLSYL
jgi:uncharacterized membrane protein